eukprot:1345089-Amorphochlora_amoeboformis.AAC.2
MASIVQMILYQAVVLIRQSDHTLEKFLEFAGDPAAYTSSLAWVNCASRYLARIGFEREAFENFFLIGNMHDAATLLLENLGELEMDTDSSPLQACANLSQLVQTFFRLGEFRVGITNVESSLNRPAGSHFGETIQGETGMKLLKPRAVATVCWANQMPTYLAYPPVTKARF